MSIPIKEKLALHDGPKAVTLPPGDALQWPIVTDEDETAVLEVLRRRAMSGTDVTKQFEREYAEWMGVPHALGVCNGTAALLASMWACGVGAGDEVICPSITYWASATPALTLGAAVNFADIDPETMCIDPNDIEHRIGPRTKAIIAVHYAAHPCDMDPIMAIARRHGVKVIEDVSHAHGGRYKGRLCGAIGDISAYSLMSGKSLVAGEAGMITTADRSLYERCVAFGHYERTGAVSLYNPADRQVTDPGLSRFSGLPIGGVKHRMNQTCAAMGRVQLRHYPERMAEIDRAMNRLCDLIDGIPGLRGNRPPRESGSTMAGWYAARGHYRAEAMGGVSCEAFCKAVSAEGVSTSAGSNFPLHLHPLFHSADLFNMGKPTMLSFGQRDVRQGPGSLPHAERVKEVYFRLPWIVKDVPELIAQHAAAFRKVAENLDQL